MYNYPYGGNSYPYEGQPPDSSWYANLQHQQPQPQLFTPSQHTQPPGHPQAFLHHVQQYGPGYGQPQAPGHAQGGYPPPPGQYPQPPGQHQQPPPLPPRQPAAVVSPPPSSVTQDPSAYIQSFLAGQQRPTPSPQPAPAFPPPSSAAKGSSSGIIRSLLAGVQSKLDSYVAKAQTPPSSAYPGAPGSAITPQPYPYGQQNQPVQDRPQTTSFGQSSQNASPPGPYAGSVSSPAPYSQPPTANQAQPQVPYSSGVQSLQTLPSMNLESPSSQPVPSPANTYHHSLSIPSPSSGLPVVGTSVLGQPVLGQPVLGQPVLGQPVLGQSVLGQPVSGQPVLRKPVAGTPDVGTPVSGITMTSTLAFQPPQCSSRPQLYNMMQQYQSDHTEPFSILEAHRPKNATTQPTADDSAQVPQNQPIHSVSGSAQPPQPATLGTPQATQNSEGTQDYVVSPAPFSQPIVTSGARSSCEQQTHGPPTVLLDQTKPQAGNSPPALSLPVVPPPQTATHLPAPILQESNGPQAAHSPEQNSHPERTATGAACQAPDTLPRQHSTTQQVSEQSASVLNVLATIPAQAACQMPSDAQAADQTTRLPPANPSTPIPHQQTTDSPSLAVPQCANPQGCLVSEPHAPSDHSATRVAEQSPRWAHQDSGVKNCPVQASSSQPTSGGSQEISDTIQEDAPATGAQPTSSKEDVRPSAPENPPSNSSAEQEPLHELGSPSHFSMESLASEIQNVMSPITTPIPKYSTNPLPGRGEVVVTDYSLHPMYVSPFLSTPQARACGVGNMPGIYDGELAVYFHPSSPKFAICSFCYETYIAPSTFASSFAGTKAREAPCGFQVPRVTRVLWPKACATGDLEPLIEYMRRRSSGTMSCCGNPGPKPASAKIKWFVAKDSSALDENAYTICEGCYEDIIGGGPWETRFAERPGWHPEGASCDAWNQSATRLIFKGDWEKFVAHVKLRLSLPECDGEFRQGAKWWKIRGCDTIDICERCYVDIFKDSRWEGIVEPKVVEPRVVGNDAWWEGNGDWRACDLHPKHNINLGFAFTFADERKLGAEELRQSLVSIASKPVCGKKEGFVNGRFYNVRGTPIPNYGVCEACYESRIVLPGLAEFFTDQPSVVPGEKWCIFNTTVVNGSQYFTKLLLEVILTGVWAKYEDKVRDLILEPPCAGVNSVEGRKWWGWTNCTACPWHYHMVLAGSRFESQMTLRAVQARPNEPGMCHFYSAGQQRRYREACDSGKLDEFFAFTEKRLQKWCELMPTINRLQAQIMSTTWASVHASIRSHSDRRSAAIDFGPSTTSYVSSSGNRYNSYAGIRSEQEAAESESLSRQASMLRRQQTQLLAEWGKWE